VQMREKKVKFSLEVPFERPKENSPFLWSSSQKALWASVEIEINHIVNT